MMRQFRVYISEWHACRLTQQPINGVTAIVSGGHHGHCGYHQKNCHNHLVILWSGVIKKSKQQCPCQSGHQRDGDAYRRGNRNVTIVPMRNLRLKNQHESFKVNFYYKGTVPAIHKDTRKPVPATL